jgi:hypothetical protein
LAICNTALLLSRKEKEKMVIRIANDGKTTREIAKEVHISLRSIGQILNKVTDDDATNEEAERKARLKNCLHMPRPLGCSGIKGLLQMWLLSWTSRPTLSSITLVTTCGC